MRVRLVALFAALFVSTALAATLPELLQKAKEQFRSGSHADALATLTELEIESAKPGFEKDRAALEPIVAFYRGASYASLGRRDEARAQFAIFLKHQPNASLDATVYSKKVIAALEDARSSPARAEPAPEVSLDAAYASYRAPAAVADAPEADWAEGPVRYLLSASEKSDFVGRADRAARSQFVETFWKLRDPTPETPENQFRAEFEKRIAFADSRFAQGETRGSLTDRGMVFVLLGPPTYVGRKPLATAEDAWSAGPLTRQTVNEPGGRGAAAGTRRDPDPQGRTIERDAAANWREVWHYRKEKLPSGVPYLQVDFDFVTKRGYGQNVLQRDAEALDTLESAKPVRR